MLRSFCDGSIVMQSTGHTGRHSSQPVHCSDDDGVHLTPRADDGVDGTGGQDNAQPMQRDSSMNAIAFGSIDDNSGSSGIAGRSSNAASESIVAAPPGGQRLIAVPDATASA